MTVNIEEAQAKLVKLVDDLAPGEELVLQRSGKPVAKLVRLEDGDRPKKRLLGSAKGDFVVPDDFDDPLPKEIEDSFYE